MYIYQFFFFDQHVYISIMNHGLDNKSSKDLNCGLAALVRAALTACSRFDDFLRLSEPESIDKKSN